MSSVAPAWSPPAEFEEFRLVRYLGGGGMGHVWLAHDLLLDRPVAVKFIGGVEPDAAATERVLAEARAAARLQHPNVAAVYRVGQLGRRPYIISEYVRGESLDRLAKPLPSARAIELAVQLCRGLGAAHRRGVLHRDLKPANAILADGGEVKLVDFGLAQLFGASPLPPIALAPPSRPSP
ncbi:MAG: serine/threonine-protein kinase, partial [Polyangia bacterium]